METGGKEAPLGHRVLQLGARNARREVLRLALLEQRGSEISDWGPGMESLVVGRYGRIIVELIARVLRANEGKAGRHGAGVVRGAAQEQGWSSGRSRSLTTGKQLLGIWEKGVEP
jgi:hypothetical protein